MSLPTVSPPMVPAITRRSLKTSTKITLCRLALTHCKSNARLPGKPPLTVNTRAQEMGFSGVQMHVDGRSGENTCAVAAQRGHFDHATQHGAPVGREPNGHTFLAPAATSAPLYHLVVPPCRRAPVRGRHR